MIDTDIRSIAGRTYRHDELRAVAMPLGGIGTGQVALCGDGGLRQWQLFNQAHHLAFVPDSFFAIRAGASPGPMGGITRILQSESALALPRVDTPLINDDDIPAQQRALVRRFGGVEETVFTGAYPFAHIDYRHGSLPVEISLEAFSPYVPLDSRDSSIPAISFEFTVRNPGPVAVWGVLAATLKNVAGWDTISPIEGNASPCFGGNINAVVQEGSRTSLVMERPELSWDHPHRGQLALSTDAAEPFVLPSWTDAAEFMGALERLDLASPMFEMAPDLVTPPTLQKMRARRSRELSRSDQPQPSPPGHTVNGGIAVPFRLEAGEDTTVRFVLSWSFPNFYVNWDPPAPHFREELNRSRLWLGNTYSTRYRNAIDAAADLLERWDDLHARSLAWSQAALGGSLPVWLGEFLAAQGAYIRSPTVFQTADGKLYGFEGTQGASTAMLGWKGYGGSCPLNCTHVWTYEQALSRLFPDLERTMRETDFDYVQAPEGYIPHRTMVPLYVKQLWGVPIGGPTNPALDGMLSAVLKTWREIQQGAGREWATRYWPSVRKLMEYIKQTWDADGDGVLDGEQPNTYDIAFYGTNMLIGSLWLAALRAAEAYAQLQGECAYAADLHALFERGRDNYDQALWNGEYYIQILGPNDPVEQQYLSGCLADQLLGQWWAHQLGLGYILPEAHVRATLRSILKYNLRNGFAGYDPEERAFADGDDTGLLIIAWPEGGQPERPTRYHDEVWTGIEYQVAAHCIYEGMVEEGLDLLEAVRARYDGAKRNPYNDIECGDHYARAMAGWTVLEALAGYRYDALARSVEFAPAVVDRSFSGPFVAGTGWGSVTIEPAGSADLSLTFGQLVLDRIGLPGGFARAAVTLAGRAVPASWDGSGLTLETPIVLTAGDRLTIG